MLIVLLSVLALTMAEPPVGDGYQQAYKQYLPPEHTGPSGRSTSHNQHQPSESINEISQNYPPSLRNDISQVYGTPFIRNIPSSYAMANIRSISTEYAPSARFSQEYPSGSQVYGVPASRNSPSEIYGAPNARTPNQYHPENRQTSSVQKYGLPRISDQSPLPSQHGTSARSHQHSVTDAYKSFGAKSHSQFNERNNLVQTYSAPARFPSTRYGAAETLNAASYPQGLPQEAVSLSGQYGAPDTPLSFSGRSRPLEHQVSDPPAVGYSYSRNALEELVNKEPASYEFAYKVNDYTSGSDFGHVESRQAERAEGTYFVVLPDGTKQVVEYEADERGFKPRISVEAASGPY